MSIADPLAMEIHARVERWALDEVPLPGKLVHQIIDWLYRENRFCRGSLKIGEKVIGPSSLSVPTLAVVNTADEIALRLGQALALFSRSTHRTIRRGSSRATYQECDEENKKAARA